MLPFRFWLPLLLLGSAMAFAVPASAQDVRPAPSITDDEVNAVAAELYCPVCENTPLDVCPTQACADWRELIRSQLEQGWTEDEVFGYFAERYGPRVLANPPAQGFFTALWLLPIVMIAAGGAFFFMLLQRMRLPQPIPASTQRPEPTTLPSSELDQEVEALI